jgi:O-antigen/teichoic acid export membrane protein
MSTDQSLQGKVITGLFWSSFANWGQGVITLLVFMVLARLLGPHDLGIFAAVMVVISFIQMFAEQGLSEAIVQRPDIASPVLDAVALINFGLALVILLATWFAAPLIAERMGLPEMLNVLRVVACAVLISALTFAQQAMLRRRFNYRWLSICSLTGTLIAGGLAIGFALAGFGVWSLAIQAVSAAIVTNLMIWSKPQWRVRFEFDFRGVAPLVSFGSKRLATNLLELVSTRYIDMFIAATFGAVALGIYAVGIKIYQAAMLVVVSAVLNVVLNGFSRIAHDRPRLLEAYYRSVGMMTATVSAAFALGAFLAPELTTVLFGNKFTESARIMEPVMLWGALQAVMWCTGTAYNAIGRPSISLGLGILRAAVILPVLWYVRDQNLITVVYSFMAAQFTTIPISLLVSRAVLGISLKRLATVLMPFVLALAIAGAVIDWARHIEFMAILPAWGRLVVLGLAGVSSYGLMVFITARAHVHDMYLTFKLARQAA